MIEPYDDDPRRGAVPCCWPDEAAPTDFDDTTLCRQPAVAAVKFAGAKMGMPSCEHHKQAALKEDPTMTVEKLEDA